MFRLLIQSLKVPPSGTLLCLLYTRPGELQPFHGVSAVRCVKWEGIFNMGSQDASQCPAQLVRIHCCLYHNKLLSVCQGKSLELHSNTGADPQRDGVTLDASYHAVFSDQGYLLTSGWAPDLDQQRMCISLWTTLIHKHTHASTALTVHHWLMIMASQLVLPNWSHVEHKEKDWPSVRNILQSHWLTLSLHVPISPYHKTTWHPVPTAGPEGK